MREQGATGAERVFLYVWSLLTLVVPTLAVGLTVFGGGAVRAVGIGLLVGAVVLFLTPASLIIRARIRRRERRMGKSE
jgi:hypothetical protein